MHCTCAKTLFVQVILPNPLQTLVETKQILRLTSKHTYMMVITSCKETAWPIWFLKPYPGNHIQKMYRNANTFQRCCYLIFFISMSLRTGPYIFISLLCSFFERIFHEKKNKILLPLWSILQCKLGFCEILLPSSCIENDRLATTVDLGQFSFYYPTI